MRSFFHAGAAASLALSLIAMPFIATGCGGGGSRGGAFATSAATGAPSGSASGLTITSAERLPVAVLGEAYREPLAVTGGSAPYSWSVTSGLLPAGIALGPDGTLTGTPTSQVTTSFRARATDATGKLVEADLVLEVRPAAAFTVTALPVGSLTVPYSVQLDVTGGAPPYTFSIASGSCASGVTLSTTGVLSGTPTADGSFSFTVRAESPRSTVTQFYVLDVTVAPPTSGGPPPASGCG